MLLSRRSISIGLSVLGFTVLGLAVSWWWLVFQQVVELDLLPLPRALPCLAGNSDTCSLAAALCTRPHLFEIKRYSAEVFWLGLGLLSVAVMLPISRRSGE